MNKRIQDAISRFGEEACIMAYDYNVNQGEGGTFIEANTGIPKRSQGAAIAAGEYLVKRRSVRKNPMREDPLDAMYVEYLRPMQDEEPFMMGGTKYEFVRARYPDGRIDIGVYSTAGDLTYGYRHWRRMMGIEKSNPVRPRKGEKTKAFVSRCMSEEKESFPKTKQRIAVCLSKSRKRNPLESGADISDDDDINTKASNMG